MDIKYECVCTVFVITWTSTTWIESQQPCIICDPSPAFLISTTPAKPWSRSHKYTDEMPPSKYLQTNGNKILENTLDRAHIHYPHQQPTDPDPVPVCKRMTLLVLRKFISNLSNSCSKLDSVVIVKSQAGPSPTGAGVESHPMPHQIVLVT